MPLCYRLRFALMLCVSLFSFLPPGSLYAQAKAGAIAGAVTDSTGALIPDATITVAGPDDGNQSVTSDGLGRYSFSGLAAGRYAMSVNAPGFTSAAGLVVDISSGRAITRNVQLEIAVVEQQVEVLTGAVLDTEPSNNASALTLSGSALQAISDDPDDLAQDLQLLAGPSTGPEGGEIFVDGSQARSSLQSPQFAKSESTRIPFLPSTIAWVRKS